MESATQLYIGEGVEQAHLSEFTLLITSDLLQTGRVLLTKESIWKSQRKRRLTAKAEIFHRLNHKSTSSSFQAQPSRTQLKKWP